MKDKRRTWLFVLLLLALLRGLLYAFTMPAWGLLDEEQHFDYILKVAETGRPPVTGKDLLDSRVVQSIFDTHRHARFHWPEPSSPSPEDWGLESYSYEGYQGPFFYYLSVPFYLLIQGSVLDQLFGLRVVMVLWSLVTVWAAVYITRDLFPDYEDLPLWVGALIICLPERTGSTGRLTNDVLLEIVSILFIWLFVRAALYGISWKRAVGLGMLAGIGILTKISFAGMLVLLPIAFLIHLREKNTIYQAALTGLVAIAVSAPFFIYSYQVYGDPTGFKGFSDLYNQFGVIWSPEVSVRGLLSAGAKMFAGFWIVWWNASEALFPTPLRVFWGAMFILVLLTLAAYLQIAIRQLPGNNRRFWVMVSLLVLIAVYLVLTGIGYFQGKFPVIQGRFLLPVLFPVVLIICLGMYPGPILKRAFWPLCIILLILDAALLFGNLLPFHYYFSAFYQNGQLVTDTAWRGWHWAAQTFWADFLSDKPAWVVAGAVMSLTGYIVMGVSLIVRWVARIKPGVKPLTRQGIEA